MCGIAGIVAPNGVQPAPLECMSDALEHRGPDGTGYLLYRPGAGISVAASIDDPALTGEEIATVGFGHKRLSIIDLTDASDQPMVDPGGRHALIYNGELYNYIELRRELEGLAHAFRTDGDTEVVLTAYREWGPECVRRFVGMWAFAVLDLDRNSLFLSRDRFGIKPLFYSVAGGALHFGSEIKALLASDRVPVQPNHSAVRRFLATARVDDAEESFFRGIFRIPPAHSALVPLDSPSSVRPARYWSSPSQAYGATVHEAAEEFAAILHDAVRVHARADVPVGTCLSGGLDSSAIVCVADRLRDRAEVPQYAHRGFGYVPQDRVLSERHYMEAVAERASLRMTYVEAPAERVVEILPLIASQQDEPFGTASIVVQWFVFEAARRAGIKVMLDGQGADEVLGGYHSYLAKLARGLLRQWRLLRYARFASEHQRLLGRAPLAPRDAVISAVPVLRRLGAVRPSALPPGVALMSPAMRGRWRSIDDGSLPAGAVNEILAHATAHQLPALLRFEDRNSMAHSIEARVPFLDHRLVEFAFRLPGEYKIRGAETKHILRRALGGILPAPVLDRRDKVGFRPDPGITWRFAAIHRDALLADGTEFEERWFDRSALERLVDGSDRSSEAEFALWRVISTKLWARSHWADEKVWPRRASATSVPG